MRLVMRWLGMCVLFFVGLACWSASASEGSSPGANVSVASTSDERAGYTVVSRIYSRPRGQHDIPSSEPRARAASDRSAPEGVIGRMPPFMDLIRKAAAEPIDPTSPAVEATRDHLVLGGKS